MSRDQVRGDLWWILALATVLAACRGNDPLLVIAGAGELVELQVRDAADRPIWGLAADRPRTLEHLFFGVVPEGYRQTVPEDGSPPRPLLPGEPLELEAVTTHGRFLRSGFASGPTTFDTTGWWMELQGPASPVSPGAGPTDAGSTDSIPAIAEPADPELPAGPP